MIKFFRKIRQNLLSEGKTGKYFKYAVGEIILVVIGILIALQINNWNEDRKNRTIEKETLSSLKSDLQSALEQLETKINQNKGYRILDSILLDAIYYKKEIPVDSLENLTLKHIWSPGFDPELGTLNEILSSGKMEIIKNVELKRHISTWNKYMDELTETDDNLLYLDLEVKTPMYSEYLPYRNAIFHRGLNTGYNYPKSNLQWNSKQLLQSNAFENMLSNYMIYSKIQLWRLIDIKHNINEMIFLIDQDLYDD
jgi:hypothetical protein